MKKLTLFRKESMLKTLICSLFVFCSFGVIKATQYCHTPIIATDGTTTVYLSCESPSADSYIITIESDTEMSGLGGSFANVNGVGGYQLNAEGNFVLSGDGKTITIPITSTSPPSLYTPLYVLISGEKNFAWPGDVEWGTCGSVVPDTEAPVMVSASVVGTPTSNSVVLALSATDNITDPVNRFIVNDITNSIVNKLLTTDAAGNATLTGLSSSTTYNLTITARDNAGNTSANSVTVAFTTEAAISECSGDKGHFASGSPSKINFEIQYIGANVVYTITPYETGRTIDFAEVQTTLGSFAMAIAGDAGSATYTHTGLTVGDNIGIRFLYRLDDMPGNEMTSETLNLTDPNVISYIVGDCEITDNEAPTGFTASVGTITGNSVELLLEATDNNSTITYEIVVNSQTYTTSGQSGIQTAYVVPGLASSTSYSFSVTAKDVGGNIAANSPISLQATTLDVATPSEAAPTPTVDASKVISIFSDAYTNVAGTNFYPGWGQSTAASQVDIAGNATMKYENFNYQGIELGSHVDASSMNTLHVDIWTPDETTFQITPISTGANEETLVTLSPLNLNEWNNFDIPLSSFTDVVMSDLFQFKIVGSGGKTVYMDNLYLYDNTLTSISNIDIVSVKCYPSPIVDNLNIKSETEISRVVVRNLLGQTIKTLVVNSSETLINLGSISSGNYFVSIEFVNGQTSVQKVIKL